MSGKKTATTPPPADASPSSITKATPLRPSSSHVLSSNSHPQSQLLNIMEAELSGHVGEVSPSIFSSNIFSNSNGINVINNVKKRHRAGLESLCTWPSGGQERSHYKPFAGFLNTLLGDIRHDPSTPKNSFHRLLHFHVWDRGMHPSVDGADLIKPDLIGVHDAESREKRHWAEVLVPVEVKDNDKEAITQLATYARAIGSCPDHRTFILGITLNHINMHARFALFHSAKVYVTEGMDLRKAEGVGQIIQCLYGMLSWKRRSDAGQDPLCTHMRVEHPLASLSMTLLLDGEDYAVIQQMSSRNHIIGSRASTLRLRPLHGTENNYRVLPRDPLVPSAQKSPVSDGSKKRKAGGGEASAEKSARARPSQSTRHSARLDAISKNEERSSTSGILKAADTVETGDLVLKSYSCESSQDKNEIRDPERDWYKALDGVYGIPVVKSYIEYGNPTPYIEESSINESPLFPSSSEDKPKAASTQDGSELPHRICSRFVLETVGTSLIEVNDNQRLVRAVMDSIIASLVAFGKGFLHSDVSIGNVLITNQHKDNMGIPVTKAMCDGMRPVFPNIDQMLSEVKSRKCTGLLIDGDHSVRLDPHRTPHVGRSGTIPFLSRRILKLWTDGKPYHLTAIDDLESFIWVTLWAFLHRKDKKLTNLEAAWLDSFTSPKPRVVLLLKELSLVRPSSEWDILRMEGEIEPNMLNLIESLCGIAHQGSQFLNEIGLEKAASPESLANKIWNKSFQQYGAYLRVMYEWLH